MVKVIRHKATSPPRTNRSICGLAEYLILFFDVLLCFKLACSNPNNAMSSAFSRFLKFYQSFTISKLLPARYISLPWYHATPRNVHLPSSTFNENTFQVNTANTLDRNAWGKYSNIYYTFPKHAVNTKSYLRSVSSFLIFCYITNIAYIFYYKVAISSSSLLAVIQIQK